MAALGLRPLAVTIAMAGEMLSISRSAAYRLIDGGQIRTVVVGSKQRVPIAEIERHLRDSLLGLTPASPPPARNRTTMMGMAEGTVVAERTRCSGPAKKPDLYNPQNQWRTHPGAAG